VSGSTASASIPWDTCTWSANEGWLSLPNASQGIDTADFVVNASLSVNTTIPANATLPPPPITQWGQVQPVPTTALPPAVTVYGPELLTIAPDDKQLRLIVESSDSGSLKGAIGSTSLGSATLRPGTNDVRFALPSSLVASLRRSADAGNILTLTPVAATGGAQGTSVTRHVLIQAPPKTTKASLPKPTAKAKPKHSKTKRHK
jgi:hypothetical protein